MNAALTVVNVVVVLKLLDDMVDDPQLMSKPGNSLKMELAGGGGGSKSLSGLFLEAGVKFGALEELVELKLKLPIWPVMSML